MIITIDGPTASGKSTLAALLAQRLGYYYLNSGFLYRGISYILMKDYGYSLTKLASPTESDITQIVDFARFKYQYSDGKAGITYEGTDITSFLKTKENDQASSILSSSPLVRLALLNYQRKLTTAHDIVAEGRDTGTVVFPSAQLKIYLTAGLSERARRWQEMQAAKGLHFTLDQALAEVQQRDDRDSSRAAAPLIVPPGAEVIDTTLLTQQETIDTILALI